MNKKEFAQKWFLGEKGATIIFAYEKELIVKDLDNLINQTKEEQKRESSKDFDIARKETIKLAKIVGRREMKKECADIALALDSNRGNEKEIAKAIRDNK